jgi:hypothetical protein
VVTSDQTPEFQAVKSARFVFARNVSFGWTAAGMILGAFVMPIVIAATAPKTTQPSRGLEMFYTILAFPLVCILSIAGLWGAYRLLLAWGPDAASSVRVLQWIAALAPAVYLVWRMSSG